MVTWNWVKSPYLWTEQNDFLLKSLEWMEKKTHFIVETPCKHYLTKVIKVNSNYKSVVLLPTTPNSNLFLSFFFLVVTAQQAGSYFSDQWSNPCPLVVEERILNNWATRAGPPNSRLIRKKTLDKSQFRNILQNISPVLHKCVKIIRSKESLRNLQPRVAKGDMTTKCNVFSILDGIFPRKEKSLGKS